MTELTDTTSKRSILLSARMQFSPEIQPIKETAIDKIVEQNLLIAHNKEGLTVRDIEKQHIFSLEDGSSTIGRAQIEEALERLSEEGRIEKANEPVRRRGQKYRLTQSVLEELEADQATVERRYNKVVGEIFPQAEAQLDIYGRAFLELLCAVFAHLGDRYVRILKHEANDDDLLDTPRVEQTIEDIIEQYPSLDDNEFRSGVMTFFRKSDPDYDAIKWGMAQNYYLFRALGLDEAGHLLSKEMFGSSRLYLDTNVIIPAIATEEYGHESFKALSRACAELGIDIYVCSETIRELQSLVDTKLDTIARVKDTIPSELGADVDDVFYNVYKSRSEELGTAELGEVFHDFLNPKDVLAKEYDVQFVEDRWFDDVRGTQRINKLSENVKKAYQRTKGWSKRDNAAEHDALLLAWISQEKAEDDVEGFLVTLDTSLPSVEVDTKNDRKSSIAVMFDALLQWISPFTINDGSDQIAAIFSDAVKQQLLPQDRFFQLNDFVVFSELEMSTRELPAEDVRRCIVYLKHNAADLDLSEPKDRERIHHHVKRFLLILAGSIRRNWSVSKMNFSGRTPKSENSNSGKTSKKKVRHKRCSIAQYVAACLFSASRWFF